MSILFRYIARLYLVNIVTLMVILGSLVVTVDIIIHLPRFARRATQIASESLPAGDSSEAGGAVHHALLTGLLIVDVWGPRLLQLFTYLNGVVLIAAAGFTCVQLVRHREFVAMLSGGLSLQRAARPFVVVGAAMIVLQGLAQEFAVPAVAHLLPRDAGDAGKRELNAFPVRLAADSENRLWYARRFDDSAGVLEGPVIWEREREARVGEVSSGGLVLRVIAADRATWDGAGWVFEGGVARTPPPPPPGVGLSQSRSRPAAAPVATPIGRLDTDLDPARLKVRYLQGFASSLSWRDLSNMITGGGVDERTRERLELVRWGRLSGLASSFIAFVGAVSLFLVKTPRPMLMPTVKASLVALGGFAAAAVATSAPIPGLSVAAGAFVPCLVLLSITVALYTGVET